jgi:hypothetical protein
VLFTFNVVKLHVILLSASALGVMLSVIMLNFIKYILLSVSMLGVIKLNVFVMNDIKLSAILLSVSMLGVIKLNVVVLNVAAPRH